jgi:hypothetical protein
MSQEGTVPRAAPFGPVVPTVPDLPAQSWLHRLHGAAVATNPHFFARPSLRLGLTGECKRNLIPEVVLLAGGAL